jgi:hypothetical protein
MAMEPLLLVCDGCAAKIRASEPARVRGRACPRCGTPLDPALDRALPPVPPAPSPRASAPSRFLVGSLSVLLALGSLGSLALRAATAPDDSPGSIVALTPPVEVRLQPPSPRVDPPGVMEAVLPEELEPETPPRRPTELDRPVPPPPTDPDPAPPAPSPVDRGRPIDPPPARPETAPLPPPDARRRIKVRDHKGRAVVAREHGMLKDRMAVMLPDGQIGWPDGLVFTEQPFVPATMEQVRDDLLNGELSTFRVISTEHYLVFYQSSERFAKASADLLERLYDGLTAALRKRGLPVSPPEFPLVSVIYATEDDFRANREVAKDVQAYYWILSNRIYFYEKSRRDQDAPEISALRKPQTVAHEGTHQILHNVGLQPRLSDWPIWLVEGFAEYCSPPKTTKNGVDWAGLGAVNPIHLATIRDLDDPQAAQVRGSRDALVARDRRKPLVEYLVTRTDLSPTDYALSWALTHYLAHMKLDGFVEYMKRMSQLKPFEARSPEVQLATFREVFGDDLVKMDAKVAAYLAQPRFKKLDTLPYYALIFEQPVGPVAVRRSAMVSQSPSVIRQGLDAALAKGPTQWQILPQPSRRAAVEFAEQWMQGR